MGVFEYDVAISFAGEQRPQARQIADCLRSRGYNPFFDEYEQAALWGKNLQERLADVYQRKAQYCLMLVSQDYVSKVWTSHERRSAQARAVKEKAEYILPVRFDDAEIPGLPDTIGYLDFHAFGVERICELLIEKLEVLKGRVHTSIARVSASELIGRWQYAETRDAAQNAGMVHLLAGSRFVVEDSAGIEIMRGVWEFNPAAQQLTLYDPDPYAVTHQIGFRAELRPTGEPFHQFSGTVRWPPGRAPWNWQLTRSE